MGRDGRDVSACGTPEYDDTTEVIQTPDAGLFCRHSPADDSPLGTLKAILKKAADQGDPQILQVFLRGAESPPSSLSQLLDRARSGAMISHTSSFR